MSDLHVLGVEGVVENIDLLSPSRKDQIPTQLRVRVLRPGASLRERKLWYDCVREGHFFFEGWHRVYLREISRCGSNPLG